MKVALSVSVTPSRSPANGRAGRVESLRDFQINGASVSIGFVRGMLSGLEKRGAASDALLNAAGILPAHLANPSARVPLAAYARLYQEVTLHLQDEGFGLFRQPLRPGTFEFLCRSILDSASLGVALERCGRFLALVMPELTVRVIPCLPPADDLSPASTSRLSASGRATYPSGAVEAAPMRQFACLSIAENSPIQNQPDDPRRVFAFEWLLRLLHGLACWLVARSLPLNAVQFPYPRPLHADDYTLIYTANSVFGARELQASFHANLLDLPIRRDNAALEAFLRNGPATLTMLYRRDRETVRRVRDALAAALPGSPGIEDIASLLHTSPRTLHRRLEQEGSSFRAIKDALRRDIALARLEREDVPVSQLAHDLGFTDTSAFFRAFRKWTGQAPSRYRERKLEG